MLTYEPVGIVKPERIIDVPSAWRGLESILGDIIKRFNIKSGKALEFGVEYGYSTVALSNFFKKVIGVDTFMGDENTEDKNIEGFYEKIKELLSQYPNINLIQKTYQDYIQQNYFNGPYDLIHIDIVHTYQDTYDCGEWAIKQSRVVLFHDTESFPAVRQALIDLAEKYNRKFYNYPFHNGLGILVRND